MAGETEIVRDYKEIREDYEWDPSIFSQEDERVADVKWIIQNRLTQVERTIILLYVDCQSFRKLGKRLRISHSTCRTIVKGIREKILKEYEHLHSIADSGRDHNLDCGL